MNEFKVGDRVVLLPLSELPIERSLIEHKSARREIEERVGPPPWKVSTVEKKAYRIAVTSGRKESLNYFSWRFKLAEPTQMELF